MLEQQQYAQAEQMQYMEMQQQQDAGYMQGLVDQANAGDPHAQAEL